MPESGYTLKEMVQELRTYQKEQTKTMIEILGHAKNVDEHLDSLNSKVATNAIKINKLETFQTRAMLVWSFVVFIVVTFFNRLI